MATTPSTTSGVLPSLLDLLAAPAATAAGKGSPEFGALLQPAPKPPVPDESRGLAPARPAPLERQADSTRATTPDDTRRNIEPPDEHESPTPERLPGNAASAAKEREPSDAAATDEEDVVAETLAGMTSCVLPVPMEEQAQAAVEEAAVPVKVAAAKGGNRTRAAGEAPAAQHSAAPSTEAAIVAKNPDGSQHVASALQAVAANPGSDSKHTRPPLHAATERNAPNIESATSGEVAVAAAELIQPVEQPAKFSAANEDKISPGEIFETLAATADPQMETAPALDPTAMNPETPVAAAVASGAAPPVENAANSTTPATSGATAAPAQARRPRLPAELLAHDAGRSARNATANVDAARLLNRVARAFATAQERDGEIQLRLSPPELGSLKLTLQMQDSGLVARVETETSTAKTAIIDNLPALRERLAEQGVRIERFDVDLMQRQPGGMPDRPGDQQHEAPPAPRGEPAGRTRLESAAPIRGLAAASSAAGGLNVIV